MKRLKTKTMQPIVYIALLLGVLALMFSMRHCSRQPFEALPSPADTINVGVLYGPLSYYIYADTLGGLNYDLLRAFSRDTHTPLKIHPMASLRQAMAALESGKLQILASVAADNELRSRMLLSESLFLDRHILVRSATSGIVKSVLDMAGDSVHLDAGCAASFPLRNIQRAIGDTIFVIEHTDLSAESLVRKVAGAEIRMAMISEATLRPMLEQNPDICAQTDISFTLFQSWGIEPGNETILNKIDKWASTFIRSKAYTELLRRYRAYGLSTENKKAE